MVRPHMDVATARTVVAGDMVPAAVMVVAGIVATIAVARHRG